MDRKIQHRKWNRKKVLAIAVSIFCALLIIYYFIFADFSTVLNVQKERITISKVKKAPFQEFIPITGTLEPIQTFYLDLSEGGKVVEKYVNEGAMLKVGDPIVRLDNPNLSLQVMSTQSSFLQAESVARQTRLTFEQNLLTKQDQLLNVNMNLLEQERIYKNNRVLFKKRLIAKNEFETSKEKYETMLKSRELLKEVLKKDSLTFIQLLEQAKYNTKMSKRYLALVKNQLENLTVIAPIIGQLTSLNVEIGQSVVAGFRIGQIDDIDSFKVRVEIDEHYISRISSGQTGEYKYDNKNYLLKIITIYPQVTNGRFFADMIFEGEQPRGIRRGQSVRLNLQLSDVSEQLIIDKGGFYNITGGRWIFVINEEEQTAHKRLIKLGRQNTHVYEVLEGLSIGEKVITSSYENFGSAEKLVLK